MKEDIRTKLDAMFVDLERTAAADKLSRHDRLGAEVDMLLNFHSICRNAIRPAMQEFVDLLATRGIKAEIDRTEEDLTADYPVEVASMRFRVLTNPKYVKRTFDVPAFTAFCDKRRGRIRFHQSTIGRNTPGAQRSQDVAELPISDVSLELVEDKLAAFVTALYT